MVIRNRYRRRSALSFLLFVSPLFWAASCSAEDPEPPVQGPYLKLDEGTFDFGTIPQGTRIEHAFGVSNAGTEELRIESVEAPDMFDRTDHPGSLQPGEGGEIVLGFDSSGLTGTGSFRIRILTNESVESEHTIALSGRIVPVIEIRPQNRLYFSLPTGEGAWQELTIVNHQDRPLKIEEVAAQSGGYFSAKLTTVREGAEYRLRIELKPDAPAGRFEETIELRTDSPELPRIPIFARAWIVADVSASPEEVRFSRVRLSDLADREVFSLKRVRVVRREGADFKVLSASTDIPFVSAEVETETEGQSYIVLVRIDPGAAKKGELKGTLTIHTNDQQFPELSLPITGVLL